MIVFRGLGMLRCVNCKDELVETSKGHYLHAIDINIGTAGKPYWIKGAVHVSKVTGCYYPAVE